MVGEETVLLAVEGPVCLFGMAYFPLALLSYAVQGGASSLLPHQVLPAMYRAGTGFLAMMGLQMTLALLMAPVLILSLLIPWVGSILAVLVAFYVMMVHARLVGLFYRRYQHKLGW